MPRDPRTHRWAPLLAAAIAAAPLLAWAAGAPNDRAAAESAIAAIEANPRAKAVSEEPVRKAKDALERARRMRAAGDDAHARLAEAVAYEWTRAAQESVRAADAEAVAASAKLAAIDAGAATERERALLEQQIAENGRMQAELRALEDAGPKAAPPPKDVKDAPAKDPKPKDAKPAKDPKKK